MLKILKSILGVRSSKTLVPREPSKPSQERLNHYQAEIELLKSGPQDNPADPNDMVPVPNRALYRDGEYFGQPLNSFTVSPEDIIPFLEVHRDQSLWFSVISQLNYDFSITYEIVKWILLQSDCDGLNAVKAFGYLSGPHFCGKHVGDRYAKNSQALPLLKLITDHEQAGKHYVVELAYDARSMNNVTSEGLLGEARRSRDELNAEERPVVDIPEATLLAGGKGTKPVEEYCVDESGLLAMAKRQAAILW
ncbi:hypothetical protein [Parasedimentitalea psychrophila]|uniref:Uncharacterized protein n=1 Tax=Parasedimentitalea psychrophila TaxID=2997337 RepID=A0A9Y2KZC4_9RHOB|nr:hypothetical protein [Parasedimentitalea psychrophila]WIY24801.1 hypothetical protein QPJ95_20220 [Parasedimentitalea psychrophila]